jgi:hypothetical protein
MSKREEEEREESRKRGRAATLPGYYRPLSITEVESGACKLWDPDTDGFRDSVCRLDGGHGGHVLVQSIDPNVDELMVTDFDLLRFQLPKPLKARVTMELDFRSMSLGPDYFAKAACPICGASVQPHSTVKPLDDGQSMSAFYVCAGKDRHQLAVVMSDEPPNRPPRYRLVLRGPGE